MKKLITTGLAAMIGMTSFGATEINNNKAVLIQKDYKVSFWMTTGDAIRIQMEKTGSTFENNPFYLDKTPTNVLPVKDGENIKVGPYTIVESENGYTLKIGEKSLYSSEFTINAKGIIETKKLLDNEYPYGMGEENERVVLESQKLTISQFSEFGNQAHLYIPFYFTNGGDAFYYNANNNDYFRFGKRNESTVIFNTNKKYIDSYYYYEPSIKKIVSKYYNFSDSKSMIPKWAFGYIQSKYGYKNQNEVIELVNKFKEKGVTVSAIVLDLYWYKKMGDFDWNKKDWPEPDKMKEHLSKNNIKLITITEPFLTEDSKYYKEFEDNNLLGKKADGTTMTWQDWWCMGAKYGSIFNPFSEKAPELLGKLYIDMYKSGIDAFWTDLGEPENTSMNTMFDKYKEGDVHNYYNREWSKVIYNAMRKEFPDYRNFILSRSGFTGSPKYGVSIWSGDSASTFESLKKQLGLGINSGVSGFSYWGSDVGGFTGTHKQQADGTSVMFPTEEELFVRWMQFGAFTPVFRAHGAWTPREPWIYPGKSEEIVKDYIKLRYEMEPYIYSTAYQTYKDGIPMMRPMYLDYQNDKECLTNGEEYMFGDHLIVAPVFKPQKTTTDKSIYIPDEKWYDFYTFEKQAQGKSKVKSEIEKIPVYIKEGAIFPTIKDGKFTLTLLPGNEKSSFTLYDDDGVTYNFEKGDYEAAVVESDKKGFEIKGIKNERKIAVRVLKELITVNKLKDFKEDGKFVVFETLLRAGDNRIEY